MLSNNFHTPMHYVSLDWISLSRFNSIKLCKKILILYNETCVKINWIALVMRIHRLLLGFQLLADRIRNNLAPIDFRSCYWQLATESFKSGFWHCLVVLTNCLLIVLFTILDNFDELLRRLRFIRHDDRLSNLLRWYELDVAVLVVVNLKRNQVLSPVDLTT